MIHSQHEDICIREPATETKMPEPPAQKHSAGIEPARWADGQSQGVVIHDYSSPTRQPPRMPQYWEKEGVAAGRSDISADQVHIVVSEEHADKLEHQGKPGHDETGENKDPIRPIVLGVGERAGPACLPIPQFLRFKPPLSKLQNTSAVFSDAPPSCCKARSCRELLHLPDHSELFSTAFPPAEGR